MGGLAVTLALLTAWQTAPFRSETALWTQASRIAPTSPWPWVNLADERTRARDLVTAERYLDRARQAARTHPTRVVPLWGADDVIAAQLAVIRMQQGRLHEAAALMAGAPLVSARGELCSRYPAICALSASSRP